MFFLFRFRLFLLLFLFIGGVPLGKSYFLDVDVTHPYFYALSYLQEKDIIQGYPHQDGVVFRPLQPILRSEALKMLYLSAEKPVLTAREDIFPDVPVGAWFAPFVEKAYREGVIQGFEDGNFRPDYQVNRAEFLKMLFLTFEAPLPDQKPGETWYQRFFEVAWKWNILDSEVLSPADPLTRGEVADYLYRAKIVSLENFEKPYIFTGFGEASYYGADFAGRSTANGEIYNPDDFTAAHRTLPFGTYVRVTNGERSVVVRINDRGPYHKMRVIDLSRRAFEELASLSRGVMDVRFEVVSGPEEEIPSVPEYLESQLDEESLGREVPTEIQTAKNAAPDGREILFEETVPHLPTDFFPTAVLRETFPQIIPQGTFLQISGRAHKYGHQKVVVFLQKKEDPQAEQMHFEGTLSGRNFVIPVSFLQAGEYFMGLIFDEEKKSRVEVIEVRPLTRKRWFPSTQTVFELRPEVFLVPEDNFMGFLWEENSSDYLTRIDFTQGQYTQTLYVEDGLSRIEIPFSYFDVFNVDQPLQVTFFQALSQKGTLSTQRSNWKKVYEQNFKLVSVFPDTQTQDVAIYDFVRYVPFSDRVIIRGEKTNPTQKIYQIAYLQTPNGLVREVPLVFSGRAEFELQFVPEEIGPHIIQIIGENRETLFKRAFYVRETPVLPVKKWNHTPLNTDSIPGILDWTNRLRFQYDLSSVVGDARLSEVAQNYADHLAENNFIAHTSLTGQTFRNRLEAKGFYGEFGENLSMAENLQEALTALENSMAHRKNILRAKWQRVGLGLAQGEDGVYVVQIFSR